MSTKIALNLPGMHGPKNPLADFLSEHKQDLGLGLGGAAAGAGLMGLFGGGDSPDLTEEENKAKLRRNLLLGASLGGVSGFGASKLMDASSSDPKDMLPGPLRLLLKGIKKPVFYHPAGAHTLNAVGRKWVARNAGLGLGLESMKDAKKSITDIIEKHLMPLKASSGGGAAAATAVDAMDPSFKADLTAKMHQLIGHNSLAGRLSQSRIARNVFGLDMTPAGGEQAVVDALRKLQGGASNPRVINGSKLIDELLGAYDPVKMKGTGRLGMLREALEHNPTLPAKDQPLSLQGRGIRSFGARTGITGIALPTLLGLGSHLLGRNSAVTKY